MFDDRGENKPANDTIPTIHSFCLWLNMWCGLSGNDFCTVDGTEAASDGKDSACKVSILKRLCSSTSSLFVSTKDGVLDCNEFSSCLLCLASYALISAREGSRGRNGLSDLFSKGVLVSSSPLLRESSSKASIDDQRRKSLISERR